MNWGKKLVIGMILFMGFVIFLGYKMMKSPSQVVEDRYYEKGLRYSTWMEKLTNGLAAERKPEISINNNTLSLDFPQVSDSVTVLLSRSGESRNEIKFQGQGAAKSFDFSPVGGPGKWKLTVTWKQDLAACALEENIFIK